MVFEHKITKMVEFSHTDMAGIMHFSNFYRFMEAVEHDLFRSFGRSIVGEVDENGTHLGWPRVHCECNFLVPLNFEDMVDLHLIIREIRNATVRYDVIFSKHLGSLLTEAARGSMTIVHVGVDEGSGKMIARPLPDWLHEKITPAPPGYLEKKKRK